MMMMMMAAIFQREATFVVDKNFSILILLKWGYSEREEFAPRGGSKLFPLRGAPRQFLLIGTS